MKTVFVPKELDEIAGKEFCVSHKTEEVHTTAHWHDCVEIIMVHKGRMKVFLGEKWHTLSAGDLVFLPSGRVHCCDCDEGAVEQTVIGFKNECITSQTDLVLLPFKYKHIDPFCILRKNELNLDDHAELLKSSDQLRSKAGILVLYSAILSAWEKAGLKSTGMRHTEIVINIEDTIMENLANPLSAYEVAERLNISHSYLCRILRENLGVNYTTLLCQMQIEKAKKYLLTTDLPITEIGIACGFCDSSYFIKRFRQMTGITPLKFRSSANSR